MHKNCATVEFRSADLRRWIGVDLRSKATAVSAPPAEVESLAENCLNPIRVRRTEFAQAAHRLRTIAGTRSSPVRAFGLSPRGSPCTPVYPVVYASCRH